MHYQYYWTLLAFTTLPLSSLSRRKKNEYGSSLSDSRERYREPKIEYDEFGAVKTTKPRRRTKATTYTGPSTYCTKTNISVTDQQLLYERMSDMIVAKFPTTQPTDDIDFEEARFDDLTEHIRKNYHMKDVATNRFLAQHMYCATSDGLREFTDKFSPVQMMEYYAEQRYNHVTNRTEVPYREAYSIVVSQLLPTVGAKIYDTEVNRSAEIQTIACKVPDLYLSKRTLACDLLVKV
ncbi:hypothetical protein M8J76_010546 [Diaphorina citri]|nr:hypothetical protein M8J76_010546 [Diaphorina citri]